MAEIKNERELVEDLRRFIRNVLPGLDISKYSTISDLVLVPIAVGGRLLRLNLDTIQQLMLLGNVSGIDLDREAENHSLTRKGGTRSTGRARLYTTVRPSNDVTIPAGTLVSTVVFQLDQTLVYQTTATRTLSGGSGATSFFSLDTQRYEIDVPIEAVEPGVKSNIGADKIQIINGSISGIEGVTNPDAVTGGRDRETDDLLRFRIRKKILGSERNIRKGLESYLIDNFDFFDASAARVDDQDAERPDGVDVYVIDDSIEETTDTFSHAQGLDTYTLTRRPVIQVSGVAGETAGVLEEGVHFEVEIDSTSLYRRSPRALDQVRILPAGHMLLEQGEFITVVYSYNDEIARAQDDLNDERIHLLTTNPLIKKAIRFDLDIQVGVSFLAGSAINTNAEQSKIELALSTLLDDYHLADPAQVSDFVVAIQTGVPGIEIRSVDQVIIRRMLATSELGEERVIDADDGLEDTQSIDFSRKEFVRLGRVTFTKI